MGMPVMLDRKESKLWEGELGKKGEGPFLGFSRGVDVCVRQLELSFVLFFFQSRVRRSDICV